MPLRCPVASFRPRERQHLYKPVGITSVPLTTNPICLNIPLPRIGETSHTTWAPHLVLYPHRPLKQGSNSTLVTGVSPAGTVVEAIYAAKLCKDHEGMIRKLDCLTLATSPAGAMPPRFPDYEEAGSAWTSLSLG